MFSTARSEIAEKSLQNVGDPHVVGSRVRTGTTGRDGEEVPRFYFDFVSQ